MAKIKKAPQVRLVNVSQLREILNGLLTSTTASVSYITEPAMCKTNNPYAGLVKKHSQANVMINFTYANSVNNALKKAGEVADFTPHARKWGTRLEKSPLVEHKGAFYLEARFMNPAKSQYVANGSVIDRLEIAPYLPQSNSNAEHQGLSEEKEVIIRDINLNNISEIKMLGEHYKVI